jgi:hypothetical protein
MAWDALRETTPLRADKRYLEILVRIPGDGDQRSEVMAITIPK